MIFEAGRRITLIILNQVIPKEDNFLCQETSRKAIKVLLSHCVLAALSLSNILLKLNHNLQLEDKVKYDDTILAINREQITGLNLRK